MARRVIPVPREALAHVRRVVDQRDALAAELAAERQARRKAEQRADHAEERVTFLEETVAWFRDLFNAAQTAFNLAGLVNKADLDRLAAAEPAAK